MSFWAFIIVGLGFCLILEGGAFALFPRQVQAMWDYMKDVPPDRLRPVGLGAAAVGVLIVWLTIG